MSEGFEVVRYDDYRPDWSRPNFPPTLKKKINNAWEKGRFIGEEIAVPTMVRTAQVAVAALINGNSYSQTALIGLSVPLAFCMAYKTKSTELYTKKYYIACLINCLVPQIILYSIYKDSVFDYLSYTAILYSSSDIKYSKLIYYSAFLLPSLIRSSSDIKMIPLEIGVKIMLSGLGTALGMKLGEFSRVSHSIGYLHAILDVAKTICVHNIQRVSDRIFKREHAL